MQTKAIEKIKNVILLVLLFTTILLLYLVFSDGEDFDFKNILKLKNEEVVLDVADAKEVALPLSVLYCNGSGEYIEADEKKELFDAAVSFFASVTKESTIVTSEISKSQYEEAMNNYESVSFDFRYCIPFNQFIKEYSIKKSSGFNSIENMSEIAFSTAASDSIFIANETAGKYFRIVYDVSYDWEKSILTSVPEGQSMYEIDKVLGVGEGITIPVSVKRKTEDILYSYEKYRDGSIALQVIAETVFGENFSFVRRINDSFGNLTYMYGFGEKTLSVGTDGTIEYKLSEVKSGESNGFYGDLQTAIDFANQCGGFNNNENYAQFALSYVGIEDDKYSYFFTQQLDGEVITNGDSLMMKIVIERGVVSYYMRHAVVAIKSYDIKEETVQAANALGEISLGVYKKSLEAAGLNTNNIKETAAFNYAAENISDIRTCYLMEKGFLIPSWQFTFKDGSKEWTGLKLKQY